ncbi:MAG: hypothetical protein QQN43_04985, partial [Nitrosopumilus sp.]
TKVLSPDLEKEVSRIFKDLNFKKIEKSGLKTFDFKDINQKILAEITSIDFQYDSDINKIKSKPKIRKAIKHLGEKDSKKLPKFSRGGIIHYSSTLALLRDDFVQDLQEKDFIIKEMSENNLDYLLLTPTESFAIGKSSRKILPSLLFVKKQIRSKFVNFPFVVNIKEF